MKEWLAFTAQFAKALGITSPAALDVVVLVSTWGPPVVLAALALYAFHVWRRRRAATPEVAQPRFRVEPGLPADMKSDIPTLTQPAPDPNRRVFVSETPAQLVTQVTRYADGIADESDKLFESTYYNKWIAADVVAMDITPDVDQKTITVSCASRNMEFPVVIAHFRKSWEHKLSGVRSSDPLKVCGQIEAVTASGVILRNCELLNDD